MADTFLKIFSTILLGVLVLQISFSTVLGCPEISNARGNITEDFIVRAGSPIRMRCSLFSTRIVVDGSPYNVSSDDLLFKFRGTFLYDAYNIDDRTIEYFKYRATLYDQGPYFCYVKVRNVKRLLFVCSTSVSVVHRFAKANSPRALKTESYLQIFSNLLIALFRKKFAETRGHRYGRHLLR